MDSNFHYTIDLNEVQNCQPFFSPLESSLHHNHHQQHLHHHQAPFNPSSSSSSSFPSPSLSYLPFLINSHQDQVHVGYNNNTFHGFLDPHLSQPLKATKFVSNGGSSSSDQMVPNKETRLKLTIRKKDNHQDQIHFPQDPEKRQTESNSLKWISSKTRLTKKMIITPTEDNQRDVNSDQSLNLSDGEEDHHDHDLKKISANHCNVNVKENEYNGSNNCVIRICFDCNTTKTPLWRSGPRGPKSLCNACGIRQRKARRAAMAATSDVSPLLLKQKMQNKNKRSNVDYDHFSSPSAPKVKKCKKLATPEEEEETVPVMEAEDSETRGKSTMSTSSTSSSSSKFYFEDLAMILSKSSAYQQVFPQDEKEAAILLMALSYGLVHG